MPETKGAVTSTSSPKRLFTLGCDGGFRLLSGQVLSDVTIAYETYGELDEDRSNAVLICHALTGDSHVARHPEFQNDAAGWWDGAVGVGKPLDPTRYFIVCSNVIGGCQGSTGPGSLDAASGRRYGTSFPIVTVRDMVNAQKALVDYLGITALSCVTGGSMGGMQALEWALMYPEMVECIIPIATCGRMSAQGIAYNEVQRQAIRTDPNWDNGDYYGGLGPVDGLSNARMLGMITYQSDESMRRKFGRRLQTDESPLNSWGGIFQVESYLRYQGEKLVNRFDANTYLYLSRAMDLHDVSMCREGTYEDILGRIKAKVLVLGIDSDILFPTYQQRELVELIPGAEYSEISSHCGHDAFLIEFGLMNPILETFLSR